MPKSKQRGKKAAAKSKKPAEELSTTKDTLQATLEAALAKASSEDAGQRLIACSDVNTLLEHTDTVAILAEIDGVEPVVRGVTDDKTTVRLEAAALIHELLSLEHTGMLVRLDRCQVPQLLQQGVVKTMDELKSNLKIAQPTQTLEVPIEQTLEQLFNAWNTLCEQTDAGMQAATQCQLPELLFYVLETDSLGVEVRAAAAQCLTTLLEDNDDLSQSISNSAPHIAMMQSMLALDASMQSIQIPMAECLLLLDKLEPEQGPAFQQLFTTVLDQDVLTMAASLIRQLAAVTDLYNRGINGKPRDDYEALLRICRTQGQALELFANLLASVDLEDGDWLNELITNSAVVQLVCQQLRLLPAENSSTASMQGRFGERLVVMLNSKCSKAVVCVTNMALSGVLSVLKPDGLAELWQKFSTTALDQQLGEDAICARFVVLKHLIKEPEAAQTLEVSSAFLSELQAMETNTDADVRAAIMGTYGCLAQCDKMRPLAEPLVARVIEFLTNDNEDLWVRLEAIDALIDIFSVDDKDDIFAACNVLAVLEQAMPFLAQASPEHMSEDQAEKLEEVQDNLPQFIAYKQSQ
eukprot:TRINITY_DN12288_c3_g1_i4.p1 TRINITY_DN12288_c3_g1~~TRINITY_DN12288_c3_g1_i4.p1  ORF type:complete len:580 (+),score=165.28 TRINITY_DN12288_c3_g1_i4:68-1807(+)